MNFIKNTLRKIFKNKKIMGLVGIIILLIVGLTVDFIINRQLNDSIFIEGNSEEKLVGEDGEDSGTDKEKMEEGSDTNIKESASDLNEGETVEESDSNLENALENNLKNESGDLAKNHEDDSIFIYVTGEVQQQGVVILKAGSRITDAIDAAGGITSAANISKINLVFVLEDGMKVNIPNDEDLKNNPDFEYITIGSRRRRYQFFDWKE